MTSSSSDPLYVTTRLLADTLERLRLFLVSLEPMGWLAWQDRKMLYNAQLCTVAIIKVGRNWECNQPRMIRHRELNNINLI